MAIDDADAQRALDRLIAIAAPASARVSEEMAREVQGAARANLKDPIGPLAESILMSGPDIIETSAYRTRVGPTLEYGRQRELGGHIYPKERDVLTAAHRAPGYWMWDYDDGLGERNVFTHEVFQVGQHYLKRGVEISMPQLLRIATRIWAEAMRAGI
jgi:hypothetical protein